MLKIWTEHGFDLFFLWRWILAVTGAVYTILRTIQSVSRWLDWLEPVDRMGRIRRHYVMVHLLRVRLSDFWWPMLQILVLIALLMLVIRGHYYL